MLEASSVQNFGQTSSSNLPPDWIEINRLTGELTVPDSAQGLTTNYSYDALRTPWRIALDAQWFNEPLAYAAFERWSFLAQEWQIFEALSSSYAHDGTVLGQATSHAMYGGAIGQLMFSAPQAGVDPVH